jgi:hypothetical protein
MLFFSYNGKATTDVMSKVVPLFHANIPDGRERRGHCAPQSDQVNARILIRTLT